jgi:hypothetical protein
MKRFALLMIVWAAASVSDGSVATATTTDSGVRLTEKAETQPAR